MRTARLHETDPAGALRAQDVRGRAVDQHVQGTRQNQIAVGILIAGFAEVIKVDPRVVPVSPPNCASRSRSNRRSPPPRLSLRLAWTIPSLDHFRQTVRWTACQPSPDAQWKARSVENQLCDGQRQARVYQGIVLSWSTTSSG